MPPRLLTSHRKQTKTTTIVHSYFYKYILNNTSPPPNFIINKRIHTDLTHSYLTDRPPNSVLNTHPPNIIDEFNNFPTITQTSMTRLRSAHLTGLQNYKHRFNIGQINSPTCIRTGEGPETVTLPPFLSIKISWKISALEDFWRRPAAAAGERFLE